MNNSTHPHRRIHQIILLTLLVGCHWLSIGCQTPPKTVIDTQVAKRPADERWIRTELFFGMLITNDVVMAESDWTTFVKTNLVPRFPDGLTIVPAFGSWLDEQKITKTEPSHIVILVYPVKESAAINQSITTVTTEYIEKFHQESVLRSDTVTIAGFYTSPKRSK